MQPLPTSLKTLKTDLINLKLRAKRRVSNTSRWTNRSRMTSKKMSRRTIKSKLSTK
jgi:hypothetical protein